jgi:23S rRNA (adenine-N6)-dimethyltransferase
VNGTRSGSRPRGSGNPRTDRDLRRRTLSQNFLRDSGAATFLDLLDLDADQLCLEVGAGEGALTLRLSEQCSRLRAFEIDPHVAGKLQRRLGRRDNVEVVVGDFVAAAAPDEPFQVVGNVPFSITSAIIDWCLRAPTMSTATIITQLEYAKKRTGAYGRWSLLTILQWPDVSWQLRGRISRTQFQPVPRVDAGVLHLARRAAPLVADSDRASYQRMVELGFGGIGGTLFASLARMYPRTPLKRAFRGAGVDPATVVAFVSPDEWLNIFAALQRVDRPAPPARRRPPRRGQRPDSSRAS